MVLESLTNPFKAEMHPGMVAVYGAVYALVGMILALMLWSSKASMVAVFLITASSIPLLYNLVKYEEEKDYHELEEKVLLKEHGRAVFAYFMLFVGITLMMAFIFIVLTLLSGHTFNIIGLEISFPKDLALNAYSSQIETYNTINPAASVVTDLTGNAQITGQAGGFGFFSKIFLNNFKVMVFCVLFSFLYGAGAIFILVWNASVIALAIGNRIISETASIASSIGLVKVAAYINIGFQTIGLRYGIHGALEILAYIVAGLAGGIISVAVARHHMKERKFEHIVIDSADLLLLAIAILFVAGLWEAFITPYFY